MENHLWFVSRNALANERVFPARFDMHSRMRFRTLVVLGGLVALIGAFTVFAFGPRAQGTVTELWVTDTLRNNRINHHAIGVGPDDRIIVTPVTAIPRPKSDQPLTKTSCTLVCIAPASGEIQWQTTVPPDECFSHAPTEPAIADIDGDYHSEVAVSTTQNALIVYDARTGNEEYQVPLTSYGYSRPTVKDFLPAPGPEIVTSDIQDGVVVVHSNKTAA